MRPPPTPTPAHKMCIQNSTVLHVSARCIRWIVQARAIYIHAIDRMDGQKCVK